MIAEEIVKEPEPTWDLGFLLDTSYPLLKRFREACPGTYKHSQALESMVEGVSVALDLEVVPMKVIAIYHDIGKMNNPKYFTENQLEDENTHKDLDPWISSQIITRHVSDSVNILINNKDFPRELIEIISQHHGTNIVKYFANKAGASKEDIDIRFRYKNTKPTCVKAAVLMLCDQVEATARSMYQNGKLDPLEVIENTIQNLIDDGQLDAVMVRLGDLKRMKIAIAKELEGTFQKRVDYDKIKEEDKNEVS